MPRATLVATEITRAGVAAPAETTGDPSGNHQFANDGKSFLLVRNSNAGSTARTVTIETPGTVDAQAIADVAISIPAGASRYIGPFPPSVYNSDGLVLVDVDHAELKLSLFHIA